MEHKIFAVHGMTCTSCSSTLYNGLSKVAGVTEIAVCLLSEKVILKGNGLISDSILSKISALGFEGEEIRCADIDEGLIKFSLQGENILSDSDLIAQLLSKNGISDVEIQDGTIIVEFVPEAIRPREINFLIEELSGCKPKLQSTEETKDSIIERQRKSMRGWLREFLLSSLFTIPILIISVILSRVISADELTEERTINSLPYYNLVMWILATPVQFVFGARFYKGAFKALVHGTANMDLLVALSTSAAYGYGAMMNFLYIGGYSHDNNAHYIEASHTFETASLLISIILLGKYLESRSKHKTTDAITKLAGLQASFAVLLESSKETEIDIGLLEIGDLVKVYPGSSVPVDGNVVQGEAWVNESMMTGESTLAKKTPGKSVFGGTINQSGVIVISVTKLGKDTALSKIMQLVESAQATKPAIQAVADRISLYFVPVVILFACTTWAVWFYLAYNLPDGDLSDRFEEENETKFLFAFKFGISVLVIACPCALGLATPTAVMVATGVAARYGILIKGGEALEVASKITKVVFDKTGTLTSGHPKVTEINLASSGFSSEQLLGMVIALESNSEHPIGLSICEGRESEFKCESFTNVEGEGLIGTVLLDEEVEVKVGNDRLLDRFNLKITDEVLLEKEKLESVGKTVINCVVNNEYVGYIAMQDEHMVNPEAPFVIAQLHKMGYEAWMITGDNERCANRIAEEVGIPLKRVIANCYPSDKKRLVEELQNLTKSNRVHSGSESERVVLGEGAQIEGKREKGVMFVGDGINDSPSLAQADIGVAIGATDIAMEASNVVLLKTDLKDILTCLDLSKKALKRIKINFFWAFIYNVSLIPLAAGLIYTWTGFYISSVAAGAAMASSSIAVIISSLMLNKYSPPNYKEVS